MQDPSQRLPIWGDRRLFEEFLDETERHLHNYTAAAYTRMDYLQRFTSAEWPRELASFREEYQRRVAEEFDAPRRSTTSLPICGTSCCRYALPVSTAAESWEQGNGWRFQVMLMQPTSWAGMAGAPRPAPTSKPVGIWST